MGLFFHICVRKRGIAHKITTAYPPECNGNAERLTKSMLGIAQAMMISAPNLEPSLWTQAVNAACFICNRIFPQSSKAEGPLLEET